MSDTPTDSWFVNDLSAHLLTCQHQLNELRAENDRLREALGPILTAHQERTERLHTMVLEAREAIRPNLEPDSPAWLREAFDKLHAIHHGMGGDPFYMHTRAALAKEAGQ